jgi:sodium-dependent dicarboxylate transporter 2/3/5
MTELLPLAVTALLVPLLAYFTHLLDAKAAMASFANPIIYLFMGGFTLAALLHIHHIDRWLARGVIKLAGGRLWPTILLFLFTTSLLSMWMSNTSTTAMMLPIALGLVSNNYPRMQTFVVLGTAYAANIGGLATLVGSPPNIIAANALNMDFTDWLQIGLPVSLSLFPVVLVIIYLVIRPEHQAQLNQQLENQPMQWTISAQLAAGLFLLTVFMWIFSHPINLLGVKHMDAMVGVMVTLLAAGLGLVSWQQLEKHTNWGILLLFGGGLTLSTILSQTGTSALIAHGLFGYLADAPLWLLIFSAVTLMIFLTELTSNTGSAAILVPIMLSIANTFSPESKYPLVLGVGIAATCAFMLPVATPPNALAYGTGLVKQRQMISAGFLLNCFAIAVIWLWISSIH